MRGGSIQSVAPQPRLVAELKRVADSARGLIEQLAKTNFDPVKFPKQRLIDIAASVINLEAGSRDGALPALEYAEAALNDLRFSFIEIAGDDQLPDVPRGGAIDQSLGNLISDISTAKRFFSQHRLDAAAKSELPDHALAASSPQQRELAERAHTVSNEGFDLAGEFGKSAARLEAQGDADHVNAENLSRQSRDVANLARQEAIEIGADRPHIAWLEKLDRGQKKALRGIEMVAGLGEITVHKIGEALVDHFAVWFRVTREWAAEARSFIEQQKRKWREEPDDRDPNRPPDRSRRDFSIFHDRFTDGSHQGPDLVVIPAGEFLMGSAESEARLKEDDRARDDEIVKGQGKRRMHIARRFALGRYPVTFDEYDAFRANRTGRRARDWKEEANDHEWGRGRRPVINVSWDDAQRYCDWLNRKTGLHGEFGYRLPSEAEWEYACRAGTETRRWWGDAWDSAKANGKRDFEGGKTSPVDHYAANPWRLHDMIGNVWEWCADRYADNLSMLPPDGEPYGEGQKSKESLRVLRGGSWGNNPLVLRSACRSWFQPDSRFSFVGFRVARTL